MLVVPAVGVTVAAQTAGRLARRAGRGLAVAGGLAALTFAATGWFYLRNVHRYGDPTAFGRIAAMLPIRGPRPSAQQVVRNPDFWWNVYRGFFGRVSLLTGYAEKMAVGFAIVTGAGVLAAVVRVLTAQIPAAPAPGSPGPESGPAPRQPGAWLAGSVVWILLAAHCLLVVATLVGYAAAGGAAFTRYLLPVLAFVVALALLTLMMITRDLARRNPALAPLTPVDRLRTAWAAEAPGPTDLALSALAGFALVGGVLLAVALWKLGDPSVAGGGEVGGTPPHEAVHEGPPGGVAGVIQQRQDRLEVTVGARRRGRAAQGFRSTPRAVR